MVAITELGGGCCCSCWRAPTLGGLDVFGSLSFDQT